MVNIQEPTSVKQIIQGMMPDPNGVQKGVVISQSPLKIQLTGDEKMILSEAIICLPRHLSDYKTKVDIELESGTIDSVTRAGHGEHTHPETAKSGEHQHNVATFNIYQAKMTVYNALKIGETVYILSFNQKKKYYILDREAEQ